MSIQILSCRGPWIVSAEGQMCAELGALWVVSAEGQVCYIRQVFRLQEKRREVAFFDYFLK